MVDKILDDNPYMLLYVEFLRVKKRHPELNRLMPELEQLAKESLMTIFDETNSWLFDENSFQLLSDFINTMILGVNILDSREIFQKNRKILEQMVALLISTKREFVNENL